MGNSFGGVTLRGAAIRYKRVDYSIAGATASVESVGQIRARRTLTRGFIMPPKKIDERELYLTVTGPSFEFVVSVDPKDGKKARVFAAMVNTAAARAIAAPSSPPALPPPVPLPAGPAPGWFPDSTPGQLRWWDGTRYTEHTHPA